MSNGDPRFQECIEQATTMVEKKHGAEAATPEQINTLAVWLYANGGPIEVQAWEDMEIPGEVVPIDKARKETKNQVYQIAYGIDTDSLEDPDQLVLLDMTWDCSEMDNDELVDAIHEGSKILRETPLLPWDDLEGSFRLAMKGEGINDAMIDSIVATVVDAFTNNFYK